MKKEKTKLTILLVLFLTLTLAGSAYLLFLQVIYPTLTPSHGGGESVSLNLANNFTYSIPWNAKTRLHLTLQTNKTVELNVNGEYLGDYSNYNLTVESNDSIFILLKSNSTVTGNIKAWQEIPTERLTLGFTILLVGLAGIVLLVYLFEKYN